MPSRRSNARRAKPSGSPRSVGDQFFLGDAARTGDGTAVLRLANTAQIEMQPHSVLRFGGQGGGTIAVELGSVVLSGGDVNLDIGAVKVGKDGRIRITANGKGGEFKLENGDATFVAKNGSQTKLELGQAFVPDISNVVISTGRCRRRRRRARRPMRRRRCATDSTIDVNGKHAEVLPAGEKKWQAVPEGPSTFAKGTKIRLGNGTTATAVASGTTLDLSSGTRVSLSDDDVLALELGSAKASVPATAEGKLTVPGGAVALKGTDKAPAIAKVDVTSRETQVAVLARLGQAHRRRQRGPRDEPRRERDARGGRHDPGRRVDPRPLRLPRDERRVVHDPRPEGPDRGAVRLLREVSERRRRRPRLAPRLPGAAGLGRQGERERLRPGWRLVLSDPLHRRRQRRRRRSRRGGSRRSATPAAARCRLRTPRSIRSTRSARPCASAYQSSVPNFDVRYKGTGSAFTLHMALGGTDTTFESTTGEVPRPGHRAQRGHVHLLGRSRRREAGQDVDADHQLRPDRRRRSIWSRRRTGTPFAGDIEVRGAVLNGWTAKVEGVDVPIDRQRRFHATVGPPPGKALAIRMSHPQHGVHYYLVRGDK